VETVLFVFEWYLAETVRQVLEGNLKIQSGEGEDRKRKQNIVYGRRRRGTETEIPG
jgi:hypothetical protein